jgi:DNA-binding Lrp family transcriptional regulator
MGRRKKTHNPLAYALIPRFMYVALGRGLIDPTAFTVWATIRLYVRDAEQGEFSPPPVDLTNREIAEMAGITVRQVRNQLQSLEEADLLRRLSGDALKERQLSGSRWLELTQPLDKTRKLVSRKPITRKSISRKPEEEALSTTEELENPIQDSAEKGGFDLVTSSGLEGGVGGTQNAEMDFPETDFPEIGFPPGVSAGQLKKIVRTLQRCHVFRSSAFDITKRMLSEDPERDAQWAEDTFYRVFNEEHVNGISTEQAIRRTVARLKNGDWGDLEDVAAEAHRRKHAARQQYYHDLAERLNRQPEQVDDEPESISATRRLWAKVLDEVKLQMTRATFDTWLRDTKCLGMTDHTLIVQVKNKYAIEWLESKLYPVIQRTLFHVVEGWPDTEPDLDLNLEATDPVSVTFVLRADTE